MIAITGLNTTQRILSDTNKCTPLTMIAITGLNTTQRILWDKNKGTPLSTIAKGFNQLLLTSNCTLISSLHAENSIAGSTSSTVWQSVYRARKRLHTDANRGYRPFEVSVIPGCFPFPIHPRRPNSSTEVGICAHLTYIQYNFIVSEQRNLPSGLPFT